MTKEEFFEIVRRNVKSDKHPCFLVKCHECPYQGDRHCVLDSEGIKDLVLENYALKEKMKWLPVSDKRPDVGEDVLVSVDTAESGKCWVTIAYKCHDFTDNEYWFQNEEMNFDMDEVLAWKPLPDAYEEDE